MAIFIGFKSELCLSLGKYVHLSKPQFCPQENGANNIIYLTKQYGGKDEMVCSVQMDKVKGQASPAANAKAPMD